MPSSGNVVGSVVPSTVISAFYQIADSELGIATNSATGAANDNSGCFLANASVTDNALNFSSGSTAIANRIFY